MRRGIFLFACLALAVPAFADAPLPGTSSFDVAPTTLDLKPGAPGLFYVTNHGAKSVMVQIEALDWKQPDGADTLAPSQTLFTSPPLARIAPGVRQSVRVLAKPDGTGEAAYRLRVSELPDPADAGSGVHVLLQFLVPVFVGHDVKADPAIAWEVRPGAGGLVLTASNRGPDAVKLTGITLNGAGLHPEGFVYILPGASHRFAVAPQAAPLHLNFHDSRSGRDQALDLATPS